MGVPVATSNTSSLKEIAEGYADLFDPYSVDSISDSIQKLHRDGNLRNELSKKSLKRAEDFSIKKFAEGFIQVFNELQ